MSVETEFKAALSHHQAGRLPEAEVCYRRTLEQQPGHADALHLLGVVAAQSQRMDEAIGLIGRAVAISPGNPVFHVNLGKALKDSERLEEAAKACHRAIDLKPDFAEAHNNLAAILRDMGRLEDAVAAYRQSLRIRPDYLEALANLANALNEMYRSDEAIELCRQAIALRGDFPDVYCSLGNALKDKGQPVEAVQAYRKAIALQPDLAKAHNNLGNALKDMGDIDGAVSSFRRAASLNPTCARTHSNLVYTLYFHPDYDARTILEEHRRWNALHAEPLKKHIRPHPNTPNLDRRLRIGYVSPDLRRHVVGRNLLPLIREHDHQRVEIFFYSDVLVPDEYTAQFREHSDVWREITGMSDGQATDLIRRDQIDVLIDLSLHMSRNRLGIFARKPAPVQISYLGYCGTTGMDAMDYRLSDPYMDPPDSDLSVYSEKTIRLPDTYWCYGAGGLTPEPSASPAEAGGYITFGCLNNFAKVSPQATQAWIKILCGVPKSRIIIHANSGSHLDAVAQRFAEGGILRDRLEFLGSQPWAQYVETYGRIDIVLDPFPWCGGITSCDALWMGVPVVTLAGPTAVGRGGASILSNLGAAELIARTHDEYIQAAIRLAGDLPRMKELRRTLRGRMQASPLLNPAAFARNVEAIYRQTWRAWCEQTGPNESPSIDSSDLQAKWDAAVSHHHAGRLQEAERIYEDILKQQPNRADAVQMLALVASQQGQSDRAVELFRQAIEIDPRDAKARLNLAVEIIPHRQVEEAILLLQEAIRLQPDLAEAHANLGNVLKDRGNSGEAIASYREAVRLQPGFADFHISLGNALSDAGHFEEAIAACRRAVQLRPDQPEAYNNLANAYKEKGHFEEATALYREALRLKPDFALAHSNLGSALKERGRLDESIAACREAIRLRPDLAPAHANLGNALRAAGRYQDAIAAFREAIRLRPALIAASNGLGQALADIGKLDEAVAVIRQAIAIRPDSAESHFNLGATLQKQWRLEESIACYRRVLALKPDFAGAHNNLGASFLCMGDFFQAIEACEQSLRVDPNCVSAHLNIGLCSLVQGDFKRGWPEYEWRLRLEDSPALKPSIPRWNGQPLGGKRILLHNDQGIGDAIQFARYAPMVAERGGRVILCCQDGLEDILSQIPGVELITANRISPPQADVHCPLLSLPMIFNTDLNSIPAPSAYLKSDARLAESFGRRLAAEAKGLKIGLVWAGSAKHQGDRNRSVSLSQFAPLAKWRDVTFVSLQKGAPASQALHPPQGMKLVDWTDELRNFSDTAALIDNLDLIISVDTAPAHLAGAMGKPVWLLVQYSPDWRWLMDREDTPWYPSFRLFRQKRFGDWESVIRRIAELNPAKPG